MRVLIILSVVMMSLAFAVAMSAQVQTTEKTTTEQPTQSVTVDRAEVVHVSGNDLVVKMEDGTIQHFSNIPDSARITVDGKEVGVHDLKPGMKLERTITTTTTPKVITTTQTVTGKVWHVTPPNSVILTLENGENQQFKIPPGQKFVVNGQETDAWGLKKGMTVTATKVVEEPMTTVEQKRHVAGSMPAPPLSPPADAPMIIAVAKPVAASPAAEPAAQEPRTLPQTGSELPLLALLGCLSVAGSAGLRFFGKRDR
jgi:LPXTG-motif cell wall-anchored protein